MTIMHLFSMLAAVLSLGLAIGVIVGELALAWPRVFGPAAGPVPALRGDGRTARTITVRTEGIMRQAYRPTRRPAWRGVA